MSMQPQERTRCLTCDEPIAAEKEFCEACECGFDPFYTAQGGEELDFGKHKGKSISEGFRMLKGMNE